MEYRIIICKSGSRRIIFKRNMMLDKNVMYIKINCNRFTPMKPPPRKNLVENSFAHNLFAFYSSIQLSDHKNCFSMPKVLYV